MSQAAVSRQETSIDRPVSASLRRNFSWTMLGNVFYALCQWGMLAVLAKLGTPEMVGQLALALAVSAPIMLFANLKLRSVQATDARDEYGFGTYFGLRLITTPVALTTIMGIAWLRFDVAAGLVITLMGMAKAIESISDIFFGLMQKQELMSTIARSQILKGALSFASFALAMVVTDSLVWSVACIALSWAAVLVLYDVPNAAAVLTLSCCHRRRPRRLASLFMLRPNWSVSSLARLSWRAVPLGLAVMLGSLGSNVPQYFIEHFRGTYDLGLYASMSYPMVAGSLVISALSQSATPRLAKYCATQNSTAFRTLLMKLLAIGFLLGVAGIGIVALVGNDILRLLYGTQYARQADVFLLIMVAVAVRYLYVFLGTAVNAMRRFGIQLPIHVIGTVFLIGLCAFLVPSHGMVGAACALVFTELLQAALYAIVVWRALATDSFAREGDRFDTSTTWSSSLRQWRQH